MGMIIAALILLRWGIPLAPRIFGENADLASIALGAGGIALVIYAFWSWANPRIVIPSVIRIDDQVDSELAVSLGLAFSVHVVLRPRNTLALDPLLMRFVAEEVGKRRQTVFSADYVLAHGRTVSAGEAVRYMASIELPDDAPCTSHERGIAWRIEVSVGAPAGFTRALPLHVRPAARRAARHCGKKALQRSPKMGT